VTWPTCGYHRGVTIIAARSRRAAGAVVLLSGLASLAALTGCSAGGRGEPSGPVRAAEGFEAAMKRGDVAAACALLSPPTRDELEKSRSEQCPKALQGQDLPDGGTADDVQVYGDQALARMQGDYLFLTNVGGTWMVSAAGCKPQPDQPYDCEVKGS
jgi:hypothetical protein